MSQQVTKTWIQACMDFFGPKPGQSKMDTGREFLQVQGDDRIEIAQGIEKVTGWKIDLKNAA